MSLSRCYEIDSEVKRQAINLRRMNRLKLADAIIAATAIVGDAALLSLDKGFSDVPGLRVTAPKLK